MTITDRTCVIATMVAAPTRLQYFIKLAFLARDMLKIMEQNDVVSRSTVESAVYKVTNKLCFSSLEPQQMIAISAFIDSYILTSFFIPSPASSNFSVMK